jgi:hypothetical protein
MLSAALKRVILVPYGPRGYQGPGDIASGAIGFYSAARAYSAAFAAGRGPIMDITDSSGANAATIHVLPTGFVDLTTLNAWINLHGTAKVNKLYDQTGSGNHVSSATSSEWPAIALNQLNGLPGMIWTVAVTSLLSSTVTIAQPISFAAVAKRVTANSASFIGSNSNPPGFGGGGTSNQWAVTGNGTNVVTLSAVSDNVFHAGQALLSNTSSFVSADGLSSSTGAGSTTGYSATAISLGRGNGGRMGGVIMETMLWGADKSANFAAINANAHNGSSGYNF